MLSFPQKQKRENAHHSAQAGQRAQARQSGTYGTREDHAGHTLCVTCQISCLCILSAKPSQSLSPLSRPLLGFPSSDTRVLPAHGCPSLMSREVCTWDFGLPRGLPWHYMTWPRGAGELAPQSGETQPTHEAQIDLSPHFFLPVGTAPRYGFPVHSTLELLHLWSKQT